MTKPAPFKNDIVGSFLRPAELKAARAKFVAGELDQAALTAVENHWIADLIEKERAAGLHAVTDGEFRRSWWHLDFLWGLTGVGKYNYQQSYKFQGATTRTDNAELVGKVAYNPHHPFFDHFQATQALAGTTPVKQTIPSPTMLFRDNRSDHWHQFYATWDEYLADLAKAYRQTIRRFYDLGCRYLQIDDTTWAFLISKLNESAADPAAHAKYVRLCQDAVTVINGALADRPADLTITTHICRGNFKSTFLFSGGYEAVAEYLGQLNYDGFFLEYDDAKRDGGFEPLATIWHHREPVTMVLGLITSKAGELEDPAQVIDRIQQASEYVPLANLALSPQCGFASTEEGNVLTADQQWAKLRLIKEISARVWG